MREKDPTLSANVSLGIISFEIMQPSPGWCINIDRRYLSNERMIENVFEYPLASQSETVDEDAILISTAQRDVIESPPIRCACTCAGNNVL